MKKPTLQQVYNLISILLIAAFIISIYARGGICGQGGLLIDDLLSFSNKKKIAITFDDIPFSGSPPATVDDMVAVNKKLLYVLKHYNIPAIGFVNEIILLSYGKEKVNDVTSIMQLWLDAGLELGNHTYSHPNFYTTPLQVFEEEVIKGETVTKELMKQKNMKPRYFRYPYLNTGPNLEAKEAFETFLKDRGYSVAQASIENEDYKFNYSYALAKKANDTQAMVKIAKEYLDFTEKKLNYYENTSQQILGRQIRHIFVLHDNPLNADYFEDIVKMMQARGYEFITLEEALKDPAYSLPDKYVGDTGIWLTWLGRLIFTQGKLPECKFPKQKGEDKYPSPQ